MRVFVSPLYTGSSRCSASSSSCILGRFLVLFLHFFLEMASESLETFLTFGASSGVLFFLGRAGLGHCIGRARIVVCWFYVGISMARSLGGWRGVAWLLGARMYMYTLHFTPQASFFLSRF